MSSAARFLIFGSALFFFGVLFKMLHYPGAGLMLLICGPALLVHAILYTIKPGRANIAGTLARFMITLWVGFIIFRIQYWNGQNELFYVCVALTVATIIVFVSRREKLNSALIAAVIICLIGLCLRPISAHHIYRTLSLSHPLGQDDVVERYENWDKYSWFLFIAGEKEAALQANLQAYEGVLIAMQNADDLYAQSYYPVIIEHQERIASGTWTQWP